MDIFSSENQPLKDKTLLDYVNEHNKKGAIDYLRKLTQTQINEEALRAGLSMIGFHHGKPAVLEHILKQF